MTVIIVDASRTKGGTVKPQASTRTVVGASFGSDKANEDVAPLQAKVVEALGLSHLEKIA